MMVFQDLKILEHSVSFGILNLTAVPHNLKIYRTFLLDYNINSAVSFLKIAVIVNLITLLKKLFYYVLPVIIKKSAMFEAMEQFNIFLQ